MTKRESPLPFDPVAVREAIRTHRGMAETLVGLLRAYGLDDGSQATTPSALAISPAVTKQPKAINARKGRRRRRVVKLRRVVATKQPSLLAADRPKIADDALDIMSTRGWRSHGKIILTELLARGHMADAKFPASTLSTAMSRDERFERAGDVKNTWVVKEQYRNVR